MPMTDFFLDHLPGYNKFRAVTIVLAIVEICVPLIGILFVAKLIKEREELSGKMKTFLIGSGVLVLFLLVAALRVRLSYFSLD